MTEPIIDVCVVDGAELLEGVEADESGIRTVFVCKANDCHTYRATHLGYGLWAPVDEGNYDA